MADKRVQLGCGDLNLALLRATKVDINEEIGSDVVKTFDEPVIPPAEDGGFTIDISAETATSTRTGRVYQIYEMQSE